MRTAEQIQLAADLIRHECPHVGEVQALSIARRLHEIWMFPGGPQRFIKNAGEVAITFRQRYQRSLSEYPMDEL